MAHPTHFIICANLRPKTLGQRPETLYVLVLISLYVAKMLFESCFAARRPFNKQIREHFYVPPDRHQDNSIKGLAQMARLPFRLKCVSVV